GMRHSMWLKLEASPIWHPAYRLYRRLPVWCRAPLRWIATPCWTMLMLLIRIAARRRVGAGPFAGTKPLPSPVFPPLPSGSLLGTAELELHGAIEELVERSYRTVLNLGAADGYYAVGLARRLPSARVVAFETVGELRDIAARSAAANRVADRVHVTGHCDAAA